LITLLVLGAVAVWVLWVMLMCVAALILTLVEMVLTGLMALTHDESETGEGKGT